MTNWIGRLRLAANKVPFVQLDRHANVAGISFLFRFGVWIKRNVFFTNHLAVVRPKTEQTSAIQLNSNPVKMYTNHIFNASKWFIKAIYLSFWWNSLVGFVGAQFSSPHSSQLYIHHMYYIHSMQPNWIRSAGWFLFRTQMAFIQWFIQIFHLPTFNSIFVQIEIRTIHFANSYEWFIWNLDLDFRYINIFFRMVQHTALFIFFVWHVQNYFDDNVPFFLSQNVNCHHFKAFNHSFIQIDAFHFMILVSHKINRNICEKFCIWRENRPKLFARAFCTIFSRTNRKMNTHKFESSGVQLILAVSKKHIYLLNYH